MANLVRVSLAAAVSAFALTGCVGGTTYGTGVSQEQQTLKDVYNMFSLKRDRKNIDYSPRPDLVVPVNTAALPEPLDAEASSSNPDWPETPEERIMRIREAAGEIDPRSGELPVEERMRRKEGIGIEKGYTNLKKDGLIDSDGRSIVYRGPEAVSEEVRKRKAELEVSKGPSRKYLTEPPVEYRIPADTAPSGEDAYTPEELAQMAKEARAARIRERMNQPR